MEVIEGKVDRQKDINPSTNVLLKVVWSDEKEVSGVRRKER